MSQSLETLSPRQLRILERLARDGQLSVEPLAVDFEVTPQTIRRDLGVLCDLGLARRRHGGIERPLGGHNLGHTQRSMLARPAKQAMAAQVVAEIPDGASLALGIGTSVVAVAEALIARRGLRVITNNLQVAQALSSHPDVSVQLAEGQLRPRDLDVVGSATVAFFTRHQVDIAVPDVAGWMPRGCWISTLKRPPSVAPCSGMPDAASWSPMPASGGVPPMCRIGPLTDIDLLITDSPPTRLRAPDGVDRGGGRTHCW